MIDKEKLCRINYRKKKKRTERKVSAVRVKKQMRFIDWSISMSSHYLFSRELKTLGKESGILIICPSSQRGKYVATEGASFDVRRQMFMGSDRAVTARGAAVGYECFNDQLSIDRMTVGENNICTAHTQQLGGKSEKGRVTRRWEEKIAPYWFLPLTERRPFRPDYMIQHYATAPQKSLPKNHLVRFRSRGCQICEITKTVQQWMKYTLELTISWMRSQFLNKHGRKRGDGLVSD